MTPERQKELETIELRARFFVNAYLRKEMGNDVRGRDVDADLQVALVAILAALGIDYDLP